MVVAGGGGSFWEIALIPTKKAPITRSFLRGYEFLIY
jgi:hypothetical protein